VRRTEKPVLLDSFIGKKLFSLVFDTAECGAMVRFGNQFKWLRKQQLRGRSYRKSIETLKRRRTLNWIEGNFQLPAGPFFTRAVVALFNYKLLRAQAHAVINDNK
jgi:hypothetical protein